MATDRERLSLNLTALAELHGASPLDPVTLARITALVGDAFDGLSEPTFDELAAPIEAAVSRAVLKLVPDATAWMMGADEWDNGWFLTGSGVTVTTATGTTTVDLDDFEDSELADLSQYIGGVGRWSKHIVTITDAHRAA